MNLQDSRPSKRFLNLPVSRKVLVITFFSSLLTLALLCSLTFIRESRSFTERKTKGLETIARILQSNTVASLRFGDKETAKEYLDSMSEDPDIRFAALYDEQDALFVFYSRDEGTRPPSTAPQFTGSKSDSRAIRHARHVKLAEKSIGQVFIELDTTSLKEEIRKNLGVSIFLFISGLALTTILASRMQLLITQPIRNLLKVTQTVTEKENYKQRARKRGNDEIGSLVDSFNKMLDTIGSRDAELKEINTKLEKKVEERTEDLNKRNAELKEAMEAAKASSIAKSEFLATISHELRTPMNAIIGMASMLKESNIDDESKDFVDTINLSSDTLLALINDVLDYSKIESGRLDLEQIPFDLLSVLEDSLEIAAARKMDAGPLCLLDCDPNVPNEFIGDSTRTKQILINLISNAVKFTEKGHVAIQVSYPLGEHGSNILRIEVSDTGIGIPQSKIGSLFQHFSQADSSTTRKYGGTGLGLAISSRLARAMGGEVSVTSEFGEGSTFTVALPLQKSEASKPIADPTYPTSELSKSLCLNQVPDPLRTALQKTLRYWGFPITETPHEPETINFVSIISDTLEQASKTAAAIENKSTTIALCRKPHLATIRNAGFSKVITHPIRLESLRRALSELSTGIVSSKSVRDPSSTNPIEPRSLRILLAEDHRINQKVFKTIMQRAGYEVAIADDGEEALRLFEEDNHHIIFMDLHMPVLDGREATKHIRTTFPKDKQPWIIAFTANAQVELARQLLADGVDDFLAKPVRKSDILKAIERYLEARDRNGS